MKVFSGLLILVLLFITACEEEDFIPREYPIVRTLAVSNITESGEITLNGEILDTGADAVISHGFIISEDSESTFEIPSGYSLSSTDPDTYISTW